MGQLKAPRLQPRIHSFLSPASYPSQLLLTLESRIVEALLSFSNGFVTQAKVPTSFHVCRESRDAVLPYYRPCFGSALFPASAMNYFNYPLDTLYVDGKLRLNLAYLLSTFSQQDFEI